MKRPVRRTLWLAILTLLLTVGSASAHEEEEGADFTARELAKQAVAFLVNEPTNPEMALERLNDAVADDEAEGVDLDTLALAARALEAGAVPAVPPLVATALGENAEFGSGPLVTVKLGAGIYWAFAIGLVLVVLGAYGLGRRSGYTAHVSGRHAA